MGPKVLYQNGLGMQRPLMLAVGTERCWDLIKKSLLVETLSFANNLYKQFGPDQNFGPDLDPDCVTL